HLSLNKQIVDITLAVDAMVFHGTDNARKAKLLFFSRCGHLEWIKFAFGFFGTNEDDEWNIFFKRRLDLFISFTVRYIKLCFYTFSAKFFGKFAGCLFAVFKHHDVYFGCRMKCRQQLVAGQKKLRSGKARRKANR